jgi:hypothetical protein
MLEKGQFPPSKIMEGNPSRAESGLPFPAMMAIPARGLPVLLMRWFPQKSVKNHLFSQVFSPQIMAGANGDAQMQAVEKH